MNVIKITEMLFKEFNNDFQVNIIENKDFKCVFTHYEDVLCSHYMIDSLYYNKKTKEMYIERCLMIYDYDEDGAEIGTLNYSYYKEIKEEVELYEVMTKKEFEKYTNFIRTRSL